MKTFVIAQHHGAFLTLSSMFDSGIKDIVVIIPGSQVVKYNGMYNENSHNPEFAAFKDYDKRLSAFIKEKGIDAKVFVVDDFNIRNTVTSTLKVVADLECTGIVSCVLSGAIVIKDYSLSAKEHLMYKEFGACMTRVYQNHGQLAMYAMVGLPEVDKSVDVNFFVADMSKLSPSKLNSGDSEFLSDVAKRKQMTILPRDYNGKDDPLIGLAISARQTIAHNLKIQAGYVVNLWNKSIKLNSTLKSEEIYGYPFNFYSKYVRTVQDYLPRSTVNKIIANGEEAEKCAGGLYECLDIIDL
jgi:hypothetical protein